MLRVKVLKHPYIQAVLTVLRDRNTGQIEFRKSLVRIGRAFGLEIIKDFEVEDVSVETPLGVKALGIRIKGIDNVVIVTVLRAAWPMVEGLIKIFPHARQGIVSARRLEEKGMKPNGSFDVEVTYVKIPRIGPDDIVMVVDPMVATGSTMERVLRLIASSGNARRYAVLSVITTPQAIRRLEKVAAELNIDLTLYTASIDPQLNSKGYIVPGLGDAGDRAFGG